MNVNQINRGSALIYAIFMLVVFGFIGVAIVSVVVNQNVASSEELLSTKALFLAETGVNIAISEDKAPGGYGPYSLGSGQIVFDVSDIGDLENDKKGYTKLYKVSSTGIIGDMKRKVEVKYKR